jgi:hypothetical protein
MQHDSVVVNIRPGPSSPAQTLAWAALWRRLLTPEYDNAPENADSEASDGRAVDQTARGKGDTDDYTTTSPI